MQIFRTKDLRSSLKNMPEKNRLPSMQSNVRLVQKLIFKLFLFEGKETRSNECKIFFKTIISLNYPSF